MSILALLPAQTAPADETFGRRHDPRPIGHDYTVFRDCLRWEFGFTCAVCLLHEHDIMAYGGAEGWGVTGVEHLVARSHDIRMAGVYNNTIYVCRLCNSDRNDTDHEDGQGSRLLDPTRDIWSEHFRIVGDRLVPFEGDADAVYTEDVYDINEPRKVKLRRLRRERRDDFLALLNPRLARLQQLNFRQACGDPSEMVRIAQAISGLRDEIMRLCRLASPGTWVPEDAPVSCRCGRASARTLPAPYHRQTVEIEVP